MLRRLLFAIHGVTAILLMVSPVYAFEDNIAAAWSFEEGSGTVIHDVSGNGNDGELKGAAEWVDGRSGKGMSFDGSSGYVEIPFSEGMRVLNQGDFTIALWLIQDEEPVEWQGIFQQTDVNGTGRAWIRMKLNKEIVTWLGGSAMPAGFIVELGEWYHAAAVVTEGGGTDTVQLYINGEPVAEASKGMEDCEGDYFVGCHKNMSHFWNGIIDDVVLIKKALDASELNDLMENGIESFLTVEPAGKLGVSWGSIKGDPEL